MKLARKLLKHIRIKHRWAELDKENEAIEKAKTESKKFRSKRLSNGDRPRQLLARSSYIIAKKKNSGLKIKDKEPICYLKYTPTLKRLTNTL